MSWWKKRRSAGVDPVLAALSYSDEKYAAFVADFVDNLDPATRAHVAVAYQNLLPIISAADTVNRQRGSNFPIEAWLPELLAQAKDTDELRQRRYSWFVFAALIARLEKIARTNNSIVPIAATIWTIIATEYPRLKILLPHNIVWTNDEKAWFDLNATDGDMIQAAVNHDIPPVFSADPIVERFARDMGLFYYPSKTRVGFVP